MPVNANDGMHNPNYVVVDAKQKESDFNYRSPQKANSRLKHVPPSVQDTLECTYESRIKAKRNYSQQFNSLNLFEHRFFNMREHNDAGKHVQDKSLQKHIRYISKDPEYGTVSAIESGRLTDRAKNLAARRGSASVPLSSGPFSKP